MKVTTVLIAMALVSMATATIIYGSLTSWWKTRTGVGFLSMMASFTTLTATTLIEVLFDWPDWVRWIAWSLVIITVNLGVVWNIIYKQFIQRRPELMGRISHHRKENHE